MKIIKLIVCILFGLIFINAGANKFFMYMPMPEMTEEQMKLYGAFGTIKWLMPLVAIIEIIGGLLFMIPKTRALGAIVILPVLVGIVTHHATFEPGTIAMPLVLLLVDLLMIADNWKRYKPMVS